MRFINTLLFTLLLTALCGSFVQAATVQLGMGQARHENLTGWNIYQVVHPTDSPPDAAYIMENYDNKFSWVGFSSAHEIIPVLEREWGCKIEPYPEFEDTYWKVTLFVYLPGTNPVLNQSVYFVSTSTDSGGGESVPSNVTSAVVEWPGKPGVPIVDNGIEPVTGNQFTMLKEKVLKIHSPVVPDGKLTARIVE